MGTKNYANAADIVDFARASTGTYLDKDGTLKTAAVDVLRVEYAADGTVKGLLIEEQRTNLVTYSEDFTNWFVGSNTTVTSDATTAPDGNQTADRIQLPAAPNSFINSTVITSAGEAYTFSVYVRAVSGTSDFEILDDLTGTGISVAHTATTEWQRFTITRTASSSSATIAINNGNDSYSADIYVWGAQPEAGSFPTSYIKTEGSQVIRAADICSLDVDHFGYNHKAGTVIVEGVNYDNNTNDPNLVSLSDGTNASRIELDINDGNKFRMQVFDATVEQVNDQSFFTVYDVPYKAGMAYEENNFVAYVNGANKITDSSGTVPSNVDIINIGSDGFGAAPYFNGHIKSIDYIPRRLTDEQLQELTS